MEKEDKRKDTVHHVGTDSVTEENTPSLRISEPLSGSAVDHQGDPMGGGLQGRPSRRPSRIRASVRNRRRLSGDAEDARGDISEYVLSQLRADDKNMPDSRGDRLSFLHPYQMPGAGYPGSQERAHVSTRARLRSVDVDRFRRLHDHADVIDRGIISEELAYRIFDHYLSEMVPHMPAVVFAPGTTAAQIRKERPTLFLSILSVGAGHVHHDIQRTLTEEVMRIYADRIICSGEKTLELVQALLVSTIWYSPPERSEELKFFELTHLAALIAIDMGLGSKARASEAKRITVGRWRDSCRKHPAVPHPASIEDLVGVLCDLWKVCLLAAFESRLYLTPMSAAMGLRYPPLIRWGPFMAECLEQLESSTESYPSDKLLCQFVRNQRLIEEIGQLLAVDDPFSVVMVSDPKVQYALRAFEHELERWSSQIPDETRTETLELSRHVANLYMHEFATCSYPDQDATASIQTATNASLTPQERETVVPVAHIDAFSICLDSIEKIFTTFRSLEVATIRCLPIVHYVRLIYAFTVLINMYFLVASSSNKLSELFTEDEIRVEYHLASLQELFAQVAENDKSRRAVKLLRALVMLESWFHKQKRSFHGSSSAGETPRPFQPQSQRQEQPERRQAASLHSPSEGDARDCEQQLVDNATSSSSSETQQPNIPRFPRSRQDLRPNDDVQGTDDADMIENYADVATPGMDHFGLLYPDQLPSQQEIEAYFRDDGFFGLTEGLSRVFDD
ncbi:hypothetical protein VTN77DRAFT_7228 [Rasamsonia byssochlamydoides]|uniref:uncharacterized protein n=1 Tax=Rasamsonia byssochlamydoides TaxID=89139 RepID=UPI0037445891